MNCRNPDFDPCLEDWPESENSEMICEFSTQAAQHQNVKIIPVKVTVRRTKARSLNQLLLPEPHVPRKTVIVIPPSHQRQMIMHYCLCTKPYPKLRLLRLVRMVGATTAPALALTNHNGWSPYPLKLGATRCGDYDL